MDVYDRLDGVTHPKAVMAVKYLFGIAVSYNTTDFRKLADAYTAKVGDLMPADALATIIAIRQALENALATNGEARKGYAIAYMAWANGLSFAQTKAFVDGRKR
ncbi:MAG: hypothetical protein UX85_C0005G0001 [Candidatus Beckwithbacteria bacterium GW2011_GWB1_47_15]|uniref:Uncharacterized protein n=1 Tax=Candidatus Beckwithbacteria bacterium GW2011_GWB1_47_15 TaxID=1618371 RepID=A0A0G1RUG6_9BACT|nr:MAG: hypothetical protein UX85_C0005G0001 [Candidatus Beckwithbacteria bacterium GW2011_GWB1_47_15]